MKSKRDLANTLFNKVFSLTQFSLGSTVFEILLQINIHSYCRYKSFMYIAPTAQRVSVGLGVASRREIEGR